MSPGTDFPFLIKEHVIESQHIREYPRATARSQEDILQLAIKQYIPKDNPDPQPGDVTIIGAQANGFPKELYEPLWADIHAASTQRGFRIRGIWIADVAWGGASGILNEKKLGNDPHWDDMARDLLHMTNVFRRDMPRPIVGIGHSFGGASLVTLALMHPRLIHSLVLVDPVISAFRFSSDGPGMSFIVPSVFRRDLWDTREAAEASFRKSPFYQGWDARVLERWFKFGLRETPTALYPDEKGKATLATPKSQEIFTYVRPAYNAVKDGKVDTNVLVDFDPEVHDPPTPDGMYMFYRPEGPAVLSQLPHVRSSVCWIFGQTSDLSPPEMNRRRAENTGTGVGGSGGLKKGRVKKIVVKGRGHLLPMEIPNECANYVVEWLGPELQRWKEDQAEYEQWVQTPDIEKWTLSQEFVGKIGRPPRRDKKGPTSKL